MIPVASYDPPPFDITVLNNTATAGRPLGPYLKAKFSWYWRVPHTATFSVKRDHPLADRILQCKRDVVPIRAYYNGRKWDGRVVKASVVGEPGNEVVTATCVGHLIMLSSFMAWVNHLTPPEFQLALTGKQDITAGPVDYVLKSHVARAAIRMGKHVHAALPLDYDIPGLPNLEDIDSIDDLLGILNSYLEDTALLSARFTYHDELFDQPLKDSGRGQSMDMWIPELDGPSPDVFRVDTLGRLQNILDLGGDNFLWFTNPGNVLGLADPSTWNKMQTPGLVYNTHRKVDRRHMIWRTDNGTIRRWEYESNTPTAHSVIVGGKAPEFVNDIVEWGANLAIKALLNALIPGANLGEILIGDLLDNILFAYQQFNDPQLEADLGPFGPGEKFADNTNAFSLDGDAIGRTALKDADGSESLRIETVSGTPGAFSFGADDGSGKRYDLGYVMTFWDRDTIVENYVSGVEVEDTRDGHCIETAIFGDDIAPRDAVTQIVDRLKSLASFSHAIANGTN